MAGIGFTLRRLTQRDDLLGIFEGYGHSVLISAGPWLFTVFSLGGITFISSTPENLHALNAFRIVVIYNFAFSLVFSGSLILVATRYLADLIYRKDVEEGPGMLLGAYAVLFAVGLLVAGPFYGYWVELAPGMRIAAVVNFQLVSGIWVASVFLTTLKDFNSVTATFALGMASAFGAAVALEEPLGATGVMIGFNIGLAVILFVLTARIFAEYPYGIVRPFAFLGHFKRYWDLALSGLVYNVAVWADKWVMWFSAEREELPSGMISFPDYDSAMFLAFLTIVPALAVFMVAIETRFFEQYQTFYRDIQKHATLDRIRENHRNLMATLIDSSRSVVVLQICIAVTAILVSPYFFERVGVPISQIGIFRLGVVGALFHVLLLFVSIVLAYFDLRRILLSINLLFLAVSVGVSMLTLEWGFAWYGFGYVSAAIVTLAVAYLLLTRELARLPYLAFVKSNASVL